MKPLTAAQLSLLRMLDNMGARGLFAPAPGSAIECSMRVLERRGMAEPVYHPNAGAVRISRFGRLVLARMVVAAAIVFISACGPPTLYDDVLTVYPSETGASPTPATLRADAAAYEAELVAADAAKPSELLALMERKKFTVSFHDKIFACSGEIVYGCTRESVIELVFFDDMCLSAWAHELTHQLLAARTGNADPKHEDKKYWGGPTSTGLVYDHAVACVQRRDKK